jgi:hypothetical protein
MPRYAIEIAGPRNERAIFSPIGKERLRGRWNFAKVAHLDKNKAANGEALRELSLVAPLIPGLYIVLDTDRRIGSVLDPLGESQEGKRIQAEIKKIVERYRFALECGADPRPKVDYPSLSADDIKTWLFHMRTMVDTGIAEVPSGVAPLPTIAEIRAMPGRRLRDPGNSGPQEAESEAEARRTGKLYRWADEVPEAGELVAAGTGEGGTEKGGKRGGKAE